MPTDQANNQEELTDKKESPQPAEPEEKSELQKLEEKVKKQEEEIKRIKEDKLETKTSPAYFEAMREQKRKQREAKILSQNLPPLQKPPKEQLETMSPSEMWDLMQSYTDNRIQSVVQDRIVPMVEQNKEDNAHAQLKGLDKIYPGWTQYIPIMQPITIADPNLNAIDALKMAMGKVGHYEKLMELESILKGNEKGEKKMAESKREPEENAEPRKPFSGGGEKPSVSVGNVKLPGKPMPPKEAARKAYEQVFENR